MKRYMNMALVYAILAMVGGVFYREFTKFNGFTAKTALAVVHTHYFLMGMMFSWCCLCWRRTFLHRGEDRAGVGCLSCGLNLRLSCLWRGVRSKCWGLRCPPA